MPAFSPNEQNFNRLRSGAPATTVAPPQLALPQAVYARFPGLREVVVQFNDQHAKWAQQHLIISVKAAAEKAAADVASQVTTYTGLLGPQKPPLKPSLPVLSYGSGGIFRWDVATQTWIHA